MGDEPEVEENNEGENPPAEDELDEADFEEDKPEEEAAGDDGEKPEEAEAEGDAAAGDEEEKPAEAEEDGGEVQAAPRDAETGDGEADTSTNVEEGCPKKRLEMRYQSELEAFQEKLKELFGQKRDLESEQVEVLNTFNGKMREFITQKTKLENDLKQKTKEIKDRIQKFQDTEQDHTNVMGDLADKISDTRRRKDENQERYYANFLDNKLLHESSFRTKKKEEEEQPAEEEGKEEEVYPPDGVATFLSKLPQWIQLGLGSAEYNCPEKGATFPADVCPDEMPNLDDNNSCLANQFKNDPELYGKLKDLKTDGGVTFAKCIKTGMDNKGLPTSKTVGIVAGDADCYQVFKEIFDPIIRERHEGFHSEAVHPMDRQPAGLNDAAIDPSGEIVIATRIRGGRSVTGYSFAPSCTFEERREIEKTVVGACSKLFDVLEGEYFPLQGSRSWESAPSGMDDEKVEELKSQGGLFKYPQSTVLLSSGMGRHWPDARGVFQNKDPERKVFIWVNEEDHLRIIVRDQGSDFQNTAKLYLYACDEVQKFLKEDGKDYVIDERLGYILNCPSNLGSGMRASVIMKIPSLSSREDFKDIVYKSNLQARSGKEDGEWDISNKDRIGISEIDLLNVVVNGAAQFVKWETALKNGDDISDEIKALMAPPEEDEMEEG